MSKDNDYRHPVPQDSYSRELDSRVQAEERPYGYSAEPPSADSGDYNTRAKETRNQHQPRKNG